MITAKTASIVINMISELNMIAF